MTLLKNLFQKRHETEFIRLNTHLCQACWECIETCPYNVIGKVEAPFHKHARIDHADRCDGCGTCISTCPNQAIIGIYKINN